MAITRAKNNLVFFDQDPAKRAPFYHFLRWGPAALMPLLSMACSHAWHGYVQLPKSLLIAEVLSHVLHVCECTAQHECLPAAMLHGTLAHCSVHV